MADELTGKTALVTGASSGIGRATALAMAAAGARIALSGQSEDRLRAVAQTIGKDALVLPADLAEKEGPEAVVAKALAALGRIDILVANAGLYVPGDVATGDPAEWGRMLAVNVQVVLRVVRAVLPGMIARRTGDIVVTSSISGHQVFREEPVYSATKHAVQAFVHGLRRQVAPDGIRVGSVAPGTVLNALWGYHDEGRVASKVASHEGLRSEDVADAVMFMLTRPPHVTIRDLVILPQNEDL